MRVPVEWLREFVGIYMSVEELAHALTMAGHEVEGVEQAGDDHVLELNITPNRPDCLSIFGVAREVSAITGQSLKHPKAKIDEAFPCEVGIEIEDKGLCGRYAGRVVRGVRVGASPEWIIKRLEKCGIRPVNNVVDATNYILLELGHPLHAFDLDTLKGKAIKVAVAGRGGRIVTLDGVERALPEEALLIWDGERPVAVAGVMGGSQTEVKETTKDIFLESAWFRPDSIRKTSRALGLKTESSYRFERGTDIEMLESALDMASALMAEVAGGSVSQKADSYPDRFVPVPVVVSYDRANRLLGTAIAPEEMIAILERLNLDVRADEGHFVVTPPAYRLDLRRDADVIEEIARLYGYERIPTALPKAEIAPSGGGRGKALDAVCEALRKEGFTEAINYSFMNEKYLDILGIPAGDGRRRAVRIRNPLRSEDAFLRTMLAPSLIENFIYNFSRGVDAVRIFETARVFEDRHEAHEALPVERLRIGGVYFRGDSPALYKERAEGFYIAKGAVESLFDRLGVKGYRFLPSVEPFLHPGKSADVYIEDKRAGFVGVISPAVMERLDVKSRPEAVIFELDAEAVFSFMPDVFTFRPIPRFPAIGRDVAIMLEGGITAGEVIGHIRAYPTEFIEDVYVFDSYIGPGIPEGKKSLAFAIRYRAKDRTLTDEEVETLHGGIVARVVKETGGEIRK